jgi:S1-C subfamily serine protease
VTQPRTLSSRPALLLACAVMSAAPALLVAADVPATAAPPAAPVPPPAAPIPPAAPATPSDSSAELDAQLEAARRRLEQAAHEVARLSAQLSGSVIDSVMPLAGPHTIIGVQLERDGGTGGTGGARVREVSPGGPAAEAGIRPGDLLVAVNGTELHGAEPARQVVRIMREVKPDSKVRVRVMREGTAHDYVITARAAPSVFDAHMLDDVDLSQLPELPEVRGAFMFHRPLMDMELATLTPRLGSYFGSDKGVLVVRAPADGALKLEDGDVILAIDGREPTSGSHATRILGSYQPGEKIALRIVRQHKTLQLEATLPQKPEHVRQDMLHLQALPHAGHDSGQPRVLIFGGDQT